MQRKLSPELTNLSTPSDLPIAETMNKNLLIRFLFLISCCFSSFNFASDINSQFLQSMSGQWSGRTIQTPVGPVDYDIEFTRKDGNCVNGETNNNFSNHY
jgi:hypothetical protein